MDEEIKREINNIRNIAMDFLSSMVYLSPVALEQKAPPEVLHVLYRVVSASATAMTSILNSISRIEAFLEKREEKKEENKESS